MIKYENRDILRLEIIFSEKCILQNKMKTSRLNVNFNKKFKTRRLFTEKILLRIKNSNYFMFDTYWKVIFQRLER